MVSRPAEYRWSSYSDYVDERKSPDWLTTGLVLGYFGKKGFNSYRKFVEELIEQEYENPQNCVIAATILGNEEFVQQITARHIDGKDKDRDLPAVKNLANRPSLDRIIQTVQRIIDNDKLSGKACIYFCHKFSGARLKEIGNRFGIGESAVSQASRRFVSLVQDDKELSKAVEKIKSELNLSRV
ncbi:MAG: hypothetical protein A2X83_01775 [Desulfuromonadales bacterium GWD2_54_10]|nr:MAG: hypothetical protein A2X83_01775 [Desulfuromonadales bacterium GWD2_54_10]